MRNMLDLLNVRIVEGLAQYGPRNITEVAKELHVPRGTVLSRIKRMSSLFYLKTHISVYHTNLGLKKAVVFAIASPGKEDLLLNCMKVNKFYMYLTRYYGRSEGCLGVYVIPKEQCTKFEKYVHEIKNLGVAQNVELYWSTCFHTVNRTTNWFDKVSGKWTFPWDNWIEEIPTETEDLPYTLVDPEDFPIKADETDLFVLKELEINATSDLKHIAKKLGTTLQNVHYHYKKHILKRGLIESFQITILPLDRAISDMFFLTLRFDSYEKLAKFAMSLLDKPFVYIVGKILGEYTLICQVYLPRLEFRNLVDSLSKLVQAGHLQTYDYVIQDLRPGRWFRETIPYTFFKGGSWLYDHDGHLKNLREAIYQTGPGGDCLTLSSDLIGISTQTGSSPNPR
jgi:DNA-binding Lrp family transcriptional regulator